MSPVLSGLFDGARIIFGFLLAVFVFFLVSFLQSRKALQRYQIIFIFAAMLVELSVSVLGYAVGADFYADGWSAVPFFLASFLLPASLGVLIIRSGDPTAMRLLARNWKRIAVWAVFVAVSLVAAFQGYPWVVLLLVPAAAFLAIAWFYLYAYRQVAQSGALAWSVAGYVAIVGGIGIGALAFLPPGHQEPWRAIGLILIQSGLLEVVICFMVSQESQFHNAEKKAESARDELQFIKIHDPLTGLFNRNHFFERLRIEAVSPARELCPLALFYMDLDHFRDINDNLTNDAGNLLLQAVAERLAMLLADTESIFRIGEDEFALLVECPHSQIDAAMLAEDILTLFNRPFKVLGSEIFLTASLGIAFLGSGEDAESGPKKLSRQVDQALSNAKLDRNTYRFYTPALADRGLSKLQYVNYLRQAIDRHELTLHFQPQVNHQGQVVSAEALLRWSNSELGSVPPSEFIPIAEEAGLIIPIGEWVIEHACAELAHWHSLGLVIPMAINLSTRQLKDVRLERLLLNKLKKYGIQPGFLHLEITESSLLEDSEKTKQILDNLTKSGFKLSIDDFGTGYANLAWLKRLPITTVKIDRSFVIELPDNLQDMAVVQAIVSMARGLGLSIIAEGVDSQRQLDVLHEVEFCLIQGFFYSRPLPSKEFVSYAMSAAG